MNNTIINQMLKKYNIRNDQDEKNAIKEIIQEIVLSGLSRGGFFNEAAFYGGAALRIFYGLNRFSEDLDFTLLEPNSNFDLSKYFKYIEDEANAYGLNVKISLKNKTKDSYITSTFLKGNTMEHVLIFFSENNHQVNNKLLKDIKIKFEVDTFPPSGATYDYKYQLLPSPHQVRLYDASSLLAGKIHAILCRNWSLRTKGRDLYDYVYFMSYNSKVNIELIKNKLIESNYISKDENFDINLLKDLLKRKFQEINYKDAKEDILPFISDIDSLNLWNSDFFISITDNLN